MSPTWKTPVSLGRGEPCDRCVLVKMLGRKWLVRQKRKAKGVPMTLVSVWPAQFKVLWQAVSDTALEEPGLLYHPLVSSPPPEVWPGHNGWFLVKRIWQKQQDVTSKVRWQKTVAFILPTPFLVLLLVSFDSISCHLVRSSRWGPNARAWGGLQSHVLEELNPANNRKNEPVRGSVPA